MRLNFMLTNLSKTKNQPDIWGLHKIIAFKAFSNKCQI